MGWATFLAIFSQTHPVNFGEYGLGYIFGDIFTNSSGRPDPQRNFFCSQLKLFLTRSNYDRGLVEMLERSQVSSCPLLR
jgi:hypothetical protein